jgi:FdhE protein
MDRLLSSGRSVFRSSEYRLAPEACKEAAAALLGLLRRHLPDREGALGRIQDAFAAGVIPPEDLVSRAFHDQSGEILAAARKTKVDEDLFAGITVLLARPFRSRAAQDLLRDVDLGQWLRGHCPACGHWPALAHVQSAEGRRTLWCLHCGTRWPFGRLQCPYCLNASQEEFELIGAEVEPSCWAHTCAGCGKYIKEIRTGQSVDAFPFEEFYLETHSSDLLARDAGFAPEGLLAVAARSPGGGGRFSSRARTAGVRDESGLEAMVSGECDRRGGR